MQIASEKDMRSLSLCQHGTALLEMTLNMESHQHNRKKTDQQRFGIKIKTENTRMQMYNAQMQINSRTIAHHSLNRSNTISYNTITIYKETLHY